MQLTYDLALDFKMTPFSFELAAHSSYEVQDDEPQFVISSASPETLNQNCLVAAANEKYRYSFMTKRKLQTIQLTIVDARLAYRGQVLAKHSGIQQVALVPRRPMVRRVIQKKISNPYAKGTAGRRYQLPSF